ncbi:MULTISPECIES: hypothetical protein [unclassified Streptomyces]|nr:MULTISPECIES: hypothetical protein [unclassified Streptomyces]
MVVEEQKRGDVAQMRHTAGEAHTAVVQRSVSTIRAPPMPPHEPIHEPN